MKHYLLLVLFLFTINVQSQTVDVRKLTEDQIRQLQIKALEMETDRSKGSTIADISAVSRGEAQKWAELGQSVGMAMVAAAKEVGAGVIEFSKSDIGKITTIIVVYKIIGKDILHIFMGILIIIVGPIAISKIKNNLMIRQVSYEYISRKFMFIEYQKRVPVKIEKINTDDAYWFSFWSLIATLISIAVGLLVALK